MESLIIAAIIYTLIAGLLYFLLQRAPMIAGEIKQWGLYAIIAIYAVVMVLKVLIPLVRSAV
jgi:hypothetical protein